MPRFLFWNIAKRPIEGLVRDLASELAIDVLLLAEVHGAQLPRILEAVNERETLFRIHPCNASNLAILSRYPPKIVRPVRDTGGIAIRAFTPPGSQEFLLSLVHLPSKLHQDEHGQGVRASDLSDYVAQAEDASGHRRTIVVGDFNMNPFEAAMVVCDGLHAVSSRDVAKSESRIVGGRDRFLFYNPMWSHFGEFPGGPAGTYFDKSGRALEYFWHIFDQVLVRPSLVDAFPDDQLQVITRIGRTSLLAANGIPDKAVGSDHLPLSFVLKI